jgi:nitrate reductase assembly molybdenum cofactor insertion protein NarJ
MVAADRMETQTRVLALFADLLEYPRPGVDIAATARECRDLVAEESPEAVPLLDEFVAFAQRTPRDTIEEIFSATFDLNASCHPYVGYHMFGESYPRSLFMLELKDRFRSQNFDHGGELPDHIGVLLRFLSTCGDTEMRDEIARDAVLPTLAPMTAAPESAPVLEESEGAAPEVFDVGTDYRHVLQALQSFLKARYGEPRRLEPVPLPDSERLVS